MLLGFIAALVLVGLLLVVGGGRRIRRRRRLSGATEGVSGIALLALAALSGAVALNLHTYQRLTGEQPAAEVVLRALPAGGYEAEVSLPDGRQRRVELQGEEWQLEARILKWHGYATVLGFDTAYRLERIGGRFQDVDDARNQRHTVYSLPEERGVDLWTLARRYRGWVPWVDAVYGNAAYMPMADGARYAVSVSATGLVARPLNEPARRAVAGWS